MLHLNFEDIMKGFVRMPRDFVKKILERTRHKFLLLTHQEHFSQATVLVFKVPENIQNTLQ